MGRAQTLASLIVLFALAACSDGGDTITVGSKNFTEQLVLGEIIAQHLEHRLDRPVKRALNLGGTLLAHRALVSGHIDLYPEYSGTALTAVLNLPPMSEPDAVFAKVREEYARRFAVQWQGPLGFNNTFAMVVRRHDPDRPRLTTLSDAARESRGWTLGMGYEFQQRGDGLPRLLSVYHLPVAGTPKTMDLGLLYRALEQGQIDMAAGNSTDGLLSILDVTVLEDDRACFPPYQAAIAVRDDALKREPKLRQALGELEGRFTEATMRRLNYQATVQHGRVQDVATQFLRDSGLR